MKNRHIIVIGASAGGIGPLKTIIGSLPTGLRASVFIVWHMAKTAQGVLPDILNKLSNLRAINARDGESILPGMIYVAPPDHHLIIENDTIRLSKGPKENRFRPAVDPLFRSAAIAHRNRVIGLVLSGALDDGTSGLWAIKQHGGITIVQDPSDAEVPAMPENASREVAIDYILPAAQIAPLLVTLTNEDLTHEVSGTEDDQTLKKEVSIALQEEPIRHEIVQLGELSPYTCPECHGVLSRIKEGELLRYRCHTGHAFSADTLLAKLSEDVEAGLWNAIRSIEESILLINHMGDHFAEKNDPKMAALYFSKAQEAEQKRQLVKKALFDSENPGASLVQMNHTNSAQPVQKK
jgi:two-component system chemotaxis response regulator CheB